MESRVTASGCEDRLAGGGIRQTGKRTHRHGNRGVIAGGRRYKGVNGNGKKYNED